MQQTEQNLYCSVQSKLFAYLKNKVVHPTTTGAKVILPSALIIRLMVERSLAPDEEDCFFGKALHYLIFTENYKCVFPWYCMSKLQKFLYFDTVKII